MASTRSSAGILVIGLMALALVVSVGAAATDAIYGEGVVVEKNVAQGTVTLEGQIVLEVGESTRIVAANGRRITLAELPVARRVSGLIEASADATVRYQGRRVGGENLAEEIRVGVQLPQ
jgi:hypothetical protein